jgi:hypothetical protein
MYSLLVLGIVPGTNIAISFQAWLILALLLAVIRPSRQLYLYLQHQTAAAMVRRPLPASQLHSRLRLTA